jgi:hypothetical protein
MLGAGGNGDGADAMAIGVHVKSVRLGGKEFEGALGVLLGWQLEG